ncbi:MAG TPA: M48 family metallopeptidase [Vicinamibacterales bacterium]|nr:M48 family metallopeptidase [Vicinamibacterales bacterium]
MPEVVIDAYFSGTRRAPSAARLIEYPGESASLLLALTLLIMASIALAAVTLGLFAAVLAFSLVQVGIRERRDHARMHLVARDGPFPQLWGLAKTAAFRLDVVPVPLYVMSAEVPNAYTTGFWGRHRIVLHSKLVSMLDAEELAFVIGHELGHIRREHVTWLVLASSGSHIGPSLLGQALGLFFNGWSLKGEYTADRAGLLACRQFHAAARALIKITFWDGPVDVDKVLRAALEGTERHPLDGLAELFGDHPFLGNRLRQLQEFDCELREKQVL